MNDVGGFDHMDNRSTLKALILAIAATASANALADERPQIVLTPEHPLFEGIHYDRAHQILDRLRTIKYGEPIQIQPNLEKNGIDLSIFDEFVVTVDAEDLSAGPNREGPW
jgi:hypothetical protein